jgi:hypothetical protein
VTRRWFDQSIEVWNTVIESGLGIPRVLEAADEWFIKEWEWNVCDQQYKSTKGDKGQS